MPELSTFAPNVIRMIPHEVVEYKVSIKYKVGPMRLYFTYNLADKLIIKGCKIYESRRWNNKMDIDESEKTFSTRDWIMDTNKPAEIKINSVNTSCKIFFLKL